MKILYLSFFNLILLFKVLSQTPVDLGYVTLDWQDDFDSLNQNNWIVVNNADHNGNPQLYKNGNVTFSNGKMNITLKNEITTFSQLDPSQEDSYACGSYHSLQYDYSSGWVETTNWRAFGYGYIEARMKFPTDYHASGGFWTWRDDDFPFFNEAEVDIVEMTLDPLSTFTTSKFSTNVHTNTSGNFPLFDEIDSYKVINPLNFDFTEWHTYGLEKLPFKLIWYVDGAPVRIIYDHVIFDEERIIFNLMLRDPSSVTSSINQTIEIDYFRSYSLNYNCLGDGVICSSLFPSNSAFQTLNVGNNTCVNNVPNGANIVLKAQDFIQLNNNFNCPIGAKLLLLTGMCQ